MKLKNQNNKDIENHKKNLIIDLLENGIEESVFEEQIVEHNYTLWGRIKRVFNIT